MANIQRDIQGQLYQQIASQEARLKWSTIESDVILKGDSDLNTLRNLRNILLTLREEFRIEGPRVQFSPERRDQFAKRLLLLEAEIQGLMKRRINFSVKDQSGGERILDYTNLLNQKQNQLIELQKKIQNLEQRLRRSNARQIQLQNHIISLNQQLKLKQDIILKKNDVINTQVAVTNQMKDVINRIKKNIDFNRSRLGQLQKIVMDGVIIPQIGSFDLKADLLTKNINRSKVYQNQSETQKYKTKLIQMFRQFQRLTNQPQGITDKQIQRILQGFLLQMNSTRLYQRVQIAMERTRIQQDYKRIKINFGIAAGVYQSQLEKLKKDNPNIRINLKAQRVQAYKAQNGVIFVDAFTQKTVEVPVQDARTKHLLHLLAVQMKKLVNKYPKLYGEIDQRLSQFFQQEIIDIIEVDQVDKLVSIVKYVPQVVKVENVYAYSNQKSRKVQFHLRVLIKALLEQLDKIKRKTGIVLEIDQGIVGMIKQQIMGVVDVDDILKVFRVVPKIVEVQKIVEKIVERVVEVPQVITVQKIIQKIVQIQKIKQVEKIVHVPIQTPVIIDHHVDKIVPIENITQRIVQVPTIVQRIVQVIRQVPKIVEVERIVDRIVEVDRVHQVEKVVNHIQIEVREVQIIKEKIVTVQKIIQKIVQVPIIVQKIVQKVVQIPQIIEIERIVQKIVPQIEYRNAREVQNHIEVQHTIVDRIVQKPIPIIQTIQKIIQVPQIIQKIVQVTNTVVQLRQIQVIKQKIVIEQRIKQVQRIVTQIVQVIKEVPRQVQKIIQIPIIHQVILRVQEFIQKPIIQRSQKTIIKQVYLRDPIIVHTPKIVEVEVIVNHYIEVPKTVKYIQQKIIQVPRHIDRIKQVRVQIDKIIQKMVEVPKVVEVEKIVQKIVVVPRIIQKVVEVPQIVQKIVQKQVIKQVIRQVQKIVQIPVIQNQVYQVEVQKKVYIQVEKIIQKIVDRLVEVPQYQQKIITQEVVVQKVIQVLREVPRIMEVQKIVPQYLQTVQIVQVQRPIIVPIQVPVPVDRIVQKIVPKEQIIQRIIQVPQIVQKIVTVKQQKIQIQEIQKIVQKIVVDHHIQEVQRIVPYIQQVIKQIPTIVQKVVPIYSTVQEIVTAQQIVEKVVEKAFTVPKVYEIEKIQQVLVEVPKFIEIQKIVPQLVRVNNYVQKLVQKIVQVPIIIQQMKQISIQKQKIVPVNNQKTNIVQVQTILEKVVILQKFKQVVRNINHIEQVLQIIDRYQQIPVSIISHEQKFIQVPYILQKIVQKIIVMPQIVQVLKYVHQVCQSQQLGVAVGVDVAVHQQKYRALSKDLKLQLDFLLKELKIIKTSTPETTKSRIELIQKFLLELQQFILFPKIVKVPQQKIIQKQVQVQKIIRIPIQDQRSLRMQLSLSLLVQKLIAQLKRINLLGNINLQIDDDIKLLFFTQLDNRNKKQTDINDKLKRYSNQINRKFQSLGTWSIDHQMMLNSFLQQRFVMAQIVQNANIEIQKSKTISQKRLQALRRYKNDKIVYNQYLQKIRLSLKNCSIDLRTDIGDIYRVIDQYQLYIQGQIRQPVRVLGQIEINDQRIQSVLRQKDSQLYKLRDIIYGMGKKITGSSHILNDGTINLLRQQNNQLTQQINKLNYKLAQQGLVKTYKEQIDKLHQINLSLQGKISDLSSEIINLHNQIKLRQQLQQARDRQYSRIHEGQENIFMAGRMAQSGVRHDQRIHQQERGTQQTGIGVQSRLQRNENQASSRQYDSGQYRGSGITGQNLKLPQTQSYGYRYGSSGIQSESPKSQTLRSQLESRQRQSKYDSNLKQSGVQLIPQQQSPYQQSLQRSGITQQSNIQQSGIQQSSTQHLGTQQSIIQQSGFQQSGIQQIGGYGVQQTGIQKSQQSRISGKSYYESSEQGSRIEGSGVKEGQLITRSPPQRYKYSSPSSTGIKMGQSANIEQQSGQSRLTGQSGITYSGQRPGQSTYSQYLQQSGIKRQYQKGLEKYSNIKKEQQKK